MKKRVIFVAAIFVLILIVSIPILTNYNLSHHESKYTRKFSWINRSALVNPTPSQVLRSLTESSNMNNVNCTLLFKDEKNKVSGVLKANKGNGLSMTDAEFYRKANHCSWLINEFDREYYVSEVELQFPLAFALNVYNAPQQIFRFLKVIYRKHNVYCIHYDKNSDPQFKQLIIQLAKCLPNVIVPSVIENVIWGWHTIVDAQLHCFDKLLGVKTMYQWKYVITLCGKEVPLRTNREMVHSLSKLNGTSAVELFPVREPYRFKFQYTVENGFVIRADPQKLLGNIPYNFTMGKSAAYFGLTESFVEFLLRDEKSITFRKFMDQTLIPDEHFIATLFMAPGIPGGYDARYASLVPTIDDYIWLVDENVPCSGQNLHHICVVNSGDLHRLKYKPVPNARDVFFHNKFFMEKDQTVIDCMEEELIHRNVKEFENDQTPTDDHKL